MTVLVGIGFATPALSPEQLTAVNHFLWPVPGLVRDCLPKPEVSATAWLAGSLMFAAPATDYHRRAGSLNSATHTPTVTRLSTAVAAARGQSEYSSPSF